MASETRCSRLRRPRGSRSSPPRGTRVRRVATSTVSSPPRRATIRWPRPSTPRRAPSYDRQQVEQLRQRRQRRRHQCIERRHERASVDRDRSRRSGTRPVGPQGVRRQCGSTLTEFSSSTCNQTTISGCISPTTISSGALLLPGRARRERFHPRCGEQQQRHGGGVRRVDERLEGNCQPPGLLGPVLPWAVDLDQRLPLRGRSNNGRIEYFNTAACNATSQSGCGATPTAGSVGTPGRLDRRQQRRRPDVANAGSGGGVSSNEPFHTARGDDDPDEPALQRDGAGAVHRHVAGRSRGAGRARRRASPGTSW